jgi:hypothetical protein
LIAFQGLVLDYYRGGYDESSTIGGNQNFKEAFLQIVEKLWNIFN